MKYPRSPYVANVTRKNEPYADVKPIATDLQSLVDAIISENEVFEIGFNMGERLFRLKNLGVHVVGGVEFDPLFGTYGNKHYSIYENFKVVLTNLDDWFKADDVSVFYTYHWLDQFPEEDRIILIDKIKKQSKKVFFVENFNIEGTEKLEGEIQVYVSSNGSEVDDRPTDSEQEQGTSDSAES